MIAPKVAPVYDLGTRADYLRMGVGKKKRSHERAGTDRLAPGFYVDADSIDEFIALGNRLAAEHGRKVKAQSYIVSAGPGELDKDDPRDQQCMGDYAFMFAKKMHPNGRCMVVVHDDGGVLHAHVTVLNHDDATGLALRDYRVHWQVKRANDELAAEMGFNVIEAKPKQPKDAWLSRRAELPEFDQALGDAVAEAREATLAHTQPSMAVFRDEAAARGVEVLETEHEVESDNRPGHARGDTAVGLTFKMRDETTPKRRLRRRKASALSAEFTHAELAREFKRAAQPAPVAAPAPVAVPVIEIDQTAITAEVEARLAETAPQQQPEHQKPEEPTAPLEEKPHRVSFAELRKRAEQRQAAAQKPVETQPVGEVPEPVSEAPAVIQAPKRVKPAPFVVETPRERLVREMNEEAEQQADGQKSGQQSSGYDFGP